MPPLPPRHSPEWLVVLHDSDLPREEYAAYVADVGAALANRPIVDIADTAINVPDSVESELTYERKSHGTLAFVLRAEWEAEQIDTRYEYTARGLGTQSPKSTTVD